MLGTSKRAHVPIAASTARSHEAGRKFMAMRRFVSSKRMNLSLGSFRLSGQRGVAASAAQAKINTSEGVWENQRFYYAFGWNAPIPSLDGPGYWTNCIDGAAVPDLDNPSAQTDAVDSEADEQKLQWVVEVTPATDSQGWMYGSHFQTLNSRREGGRACRRPADFVRRRKWLQRSLPGPHASSEDPLAGATNTAGQATPPQGRPRTSTFVSRSDAMHMSPASAAKADDTRRSNVKLSAGTAAKAFFSMLQDAAKRRGGGLMSIPWDPMSWGSVYSTHSAWLSNTQALLLPRRLHQIQEGAIYDAQRSTGIHTVMTEELAEDMRSTVDFARAAYGYAFLSGGLSSISRYLHMQTLQRSTFDVISGVSAEENTLAFCAVTQVSIGDVVLAEWQNTTYRPCHILAVDRERQRIVLTIRGSLELGDLLTDLHAKPIAVHLAACGDNTECHVHEGMLRAAAFVHCNTADALEEASGRFPEWPLFVTGHSLGGGVAALVAVLLHQQGGAPEQLQANGITCMTIGTGSSMCARLSAACKDYVTSLVLSNDVVPRLSYHTVEYLLDELIRKSPALNFAESVRSSVALTFAPFTTAGRAAATDAAAAAAAAGAGFGGAGGAVAAAGESEAIQLAEMPSAEGLSGLDLGGGGFTARSLSGPVAGVSGGFSGAIAASRNESPRDPRHTTPSSNEFESAVSTGGALEVCFRGADVVGLSTGVSRRVTTGVENAARTAGAAGSAGVFPSEEISPYTSADGELKEPSTRFDGGAAAAVPAVAAQQAHQALQAAWDKQASSSSVKQVAAPPPPSLAEEMDRMWAQVQIDEEQKVMMYADGMATGAPQKPPSRGGETSVWRKLLAPVEGILGGVAQEATPFSTEAIRMLADKERAEQKRVAKSKAEDLPPGAPLRDVSVANPLRYLAETGISRSRGNPDTVSTGEPGLAEQYAATAMDAGAFSTDEILDRHAAAATSPRSTTKSAKVQAIDDSVLNQADAGHAAAEASSTPPPPLYPPGRVLWLIPLKAQTPPASPRAAGADAAATATPPAAAAELDPLATPPTLHSVTSGVPSACGAGAAQIASTSQLPSHPHRLSTRDVFHQPYSPPKTSTAARHTSPSFIDDSQPAPTNPNSLGPRSKSHSALARTHTANAAHLNGQSQGVAAPISRETSDRSNKSASPTHPHTHLLQSNQRQRSSTLNRPPKRNRSFGRTQSDTTALRASLDGVKGTSNHLEGIAASTLEGGSNGEKLEDVEGALYDDDFSEDYGHTNSGVRGNTSIRRKSAPALELREHKEGVFKDPTPDIDANEKWAQQAISDRLKAVRSGMSTRTIANSGGTGGEPSSSDCAQASQQNQPQQQPLPSESILEVSDDVATAAKGVSGRSKFIQIAGEALLSAGDEAAAVAGDSSTPKGAKPETGNTAGPLRQPQPRLPSPGVISDAGFCLAFSLRRSKRKDLDAGADIAAGAFAAGLADTDPLGRVPEEGANADEVQGGRGGWDAAPKWLQRLVQRPPNTQSWPSGFDADEQQAAFSLSQSPIKGSSDAAGNDMSLDSHPVALSAGTLTADSSPAGSPNGKRGGGSDVDSAKFNGEQSTEFVIENSRHMCGNLREASVGAPGADGPDPRSDEEAADVAVIDVTDRRNVFNYLTLCADMVQDHLPDQYTKAVALILSQTKSSK